MKYEEFDQQIREMIPQPSAAITDALYRMGVEALEDRPQDLLIAFEFISRYFSVDVLQGVYEIIQHGSAVLPNELVAAAVFLQTSPFYFRFSLCSKRKRLRWVSGCILAFLCLLFIEINKLAKSNFGDET